MAEKQIATKMAEGVTMIKRVNFECCMWLVEGTDSALLIDTGIGVGNLRAEVEELTKLPYKVVNTHGHGDHAGGNYLFDCVYMHKNALPAAENAIGMTKMIASQEEIDEIQKQMRERPYTVKFVAEGDEFDLGGRRLRVVETPGHTPGDITLFDYDNGILFSGDCMVKSMPVLLIGLQTVSVACYAKSMHKLLSLDGVRGFYSGHDQRLMPRSFLQDCADCADEIVAGTADCCEAENIISEGEKNCMRAVHGEAAIMYRSHQIH